MAASRNSGGKSELSTAHLARNDKPMNSTTVPTRATVLPPNSQFFARAMSTSMALGAAGFIGAGIATGAGAADGAGGTSAMAVACSAATGAIAGIADIAGSGIVGNGCVAASTLIGVLTGLTATVAGRVLATRAISLRTALRKVQPASAPKKAPTIHSQSPRRDTDTLRMAPQIAPQIIMSFPMTRLESLLTMR